MPSFTCPAVAGAVLWAGYRPLFVDVDRDHWHLDAVALTEVVDQHRDDLAAIVAVANFGTNPGRELVNSWESCAERAGAPLILDAAAGLGSVRPAGQATVFSFEATKPTGLGEGGLLLAPERSTVERVALLAYYGIENGVAVAPGLNGKLSELSAAAALCRLDSAEDLLARQRQRGRDLINRLNGIVAFQRDAEDSAWQFGQVLLRDSATRQTALRLAALRRIQVKTLWAPALHRHPAFTELPRAPLPVTENLATRVLSLPMAHDLSSEEMALCAELVIDACAQEGPGRAAL
jgi:dTDP-4-amino-4,6-dideoxygalactose transaminase